MDTLSFAIGALSIVGLILIGLAVLGVVKAYRAIKQITDVNFALETFRKDIESRLSNESSDAFRTIENETREIHQRISTVEREAVEYVANEIRATRSYIDSRIDKLEKPKTSTPNSVNSQITDAVTQKVLIKD
jgi:hypothetical protein